MAKQIELTRVGSACHEQLPASFVELAPATETSECDTTVEAGAALRSSVASKRWVPYQYEGQHPSAMSHARFDRTTRPDLQPASAAAAKQAAAANLSASAGD